MTTETAARPLTAEDIEALDTLAVWHKPGCDVPFIAGVLACGRFTPQEIQAAWEAFQEAVIWREMLGTGSRHWVERFDEADLPPGDGPTSAAIQLACEVADEARHHFVHGGPQ